MKSHVTFGPIHHAKPRSIPKRGCYMRIRGRGMHAGASTESIDMMGLAAGLYAAQPGCSPSHLSVPLQVGEMLIPARSYERLLPGGRCRWL
jgi:hypothetical protein